MYCVSACVVLCVFVCVCNCNQVHELSLLTYTDCKLCIHKDRDKKVEVCPRYATKACGGVKVKLHSFLTLTLDGGDWSASYTSLFTHRQRVPNVYWIGGWVDSRASLHILEKWKISCPCLIQTSYHWSHSLVTIPTMVSLLLMYLCK
jgi:hypothetical protein